MSRSWNGESLVDEFSALLGDTSTAFKTRVLGWVNDTIIDISTKHDWAFHLVKGKKFLAQDIEEHLLEVDPPGASDIELDDAGELSAGSIYSVLFTFSQDSGVESLAGEVTSEVVTTASLKSIYLDNIPTSDESLVTKRNIYLKKDDGEFYFHSTIEDNFTTSYTVDTDVDSTVEAPDYAAIRRLKGSPFFEDNRAKYLDYRDIEQLRKLAQGQWSSGTPEYFTPMAQNSIATYPVPGEEMEVSFYYYRTPFRLYYSEDSQPDIPAYLKPVLKAGVIAMGFEYRDRDRQEMKKADYQNALYDAINRGGRVANVEYSVRDVYGNYSGFEVN
jgi:hypothetical protein